MAGGGADGMGRGPSAGGELGGNEGPGGGGNRGKKKGQSKMDLWLRGKRTTTTVKRGKDSGMTNTSYDSNYRPTAAKKTRVGQKNPIKATVYAAGSNVLDREKRKTYDQMLKQGTRADDPRNWEFHYKDPGKNAGITGPSKGMSTQERRTARFSSARRKAERDAKLAGKDVYEAKKLEYETETLKGDTRQASANRKATGAGRFGSTQVAQNVAAQKQMSNRKVARGRARTTDAFESAPKKRGAIA